MVNHLSIINKCLGRSLSIPKIGRAPRVDRYSKNRYKYKMNPNDEIGKDDYIPYWDLTEDYYRSPGDHYGYRRTLDAENQEQYMAEEVGNNSYNVSYNVADRYNNSDIRRQHIFGRNLDFNTAVKMVEKLVRTHPRRK